ncbi:MAG: helix-turn-helix domain-containing protein [Kiritimatiellae bacterium]|nr:helix-turn-helix domain-containing protein [Kiritimatiellia bacterium]
MSHERTVQTWLFRPPPAGASAWFDRVEHGVVSEEVYPRILPAHFNLGVLVRGELMLRNGEAQTRVRAGQMFCQWARIPYRAWTEGGVEAEFYRVRVRGTRARGYAEAFGFNPSRFVVDPYDARAVVEVFVCLAALYADRAGRDEYEAVCLVYALAKAGAVRVRTARAGADAEAELVEQGVASMEALLHTPLPVSEVARSLGVSRATLLRLFRKHLHTTPLRYLTRLRLLRARELLTRTDLKVEAVARACGFRNEKYFYRCFRKHERETPAAHRRRNLPGSTDVRA